MFPVIGDNLDDSVAISAEAHLWSLAADPSLDQDALVPALASEVALIITGSAARDGDDREELARLRPSP